MVTHRSGWCRHWKATKLFYKLYVIHVLYHIRISNERNRILWIVIYIQSSHVSEVKHQMNSNDRINDHSISWYSVWLSLTSDCFFIQFMYQTQSVSLGFQSRKSGSFYRKCRQNKAKKHSLSLLIRVTSGRVQVYSHSCCLGSCYPSRSQTLFVATSPFCPTEPSLNRPPLHTKKTNTEIAHGVSSARTVSKKNSWIDELI